MFCFIPAATTIKIDKMWGVLSRYFITGYIVKNINKGKITAYNHF